MTIRGITIVTVITTEGRNGGCTCLTGFGKTSITSSPPASPGGDRKRVDRAMTELNDLQSKLSQRQYDQPELDDSIGAIQEVVQDNRLGPHDRDMLTEDLNRMREYREHHTDWR
jgi:hypothetical protein